MLSDSDTIKLLIFGCVDMFLKSRSGCSCWIRLRMQGFKRCARD